jgi:imidazolonepropionase
VTTRQLEERNGAPAALLRDVMDSNASFPDVHPGHAISQSAHGTQIRRPVCARYAGERAPPRTGAAFTRSLVALLIRRARQLLTLHGPEGPRRGAALRDLGIIADGALLLRDGVVVEAGPTRRVENLAISQRAAHALDAHGRVVMPGFVDSDTHFIFAQSGIERNEHRTGDAATRPAASIPEWIVRDAHSTARLTIRARQRLRRMVQYGSTTIEVKSGYGIDESGELKMLRVARALRDETADIVPSLLAGQNAGAESYGDVERYFDYLCEDLLPKVSRRRLVKCAGLVCDAERFTAVQMRRYLRTARHLRLLTHLHARSGGTPETVRLAAEEGATSVGHLESWDEATVGALRESSTIATLAPALALQPGAGAPPSARAPIDGGAAVALATNFNPESRSTYSMQMAIALACSQMGMTPAEAISAATINGAYALGAGRRAGSLEPGKAADVLILNAGDYREIPFVAGVNHVRAVLKRGEVVYDEEG